MRDGWCVEPTTHHPSPTAPYPGRREARGVSASRAGLCVLVEACLPGGELRVVLLRLRDRQAHVAAERAPLEPLARREDGLHRAPVLPHEAAHVAQPVAAAVQPEGALAELQVEPRRRR